MYQLPALVVELDSRIYTVGCDGERVGILSPGVGAYRNLGYLYRSFLDRDLCPHALVGGCYLYCGHEFCLVPSAFERLLLLSQHQSMRKH